SGGEHRVQVHLPEAAAGQRPCLGLTGGDDPAEVERLGHDRPLASFAKFADCRPGQLKTNVNVLASQLLIAGIWLSANTVTTIT
ncbi:hypothetical protein, partial [Sedimentibacter sp. B4]|uniref:hypothetical protein n=1 Tax=Sedimentibacter sp. B4 TaxID=304766 RepID=UPI0018DC2FA8